MNETIPAAEGGSSIGKPVSQMGEHTPGPWQLTQDLAWLSHSCCYDYAITGYEDGKKIGVAETLEGANARLIAAAPDMLAALIASEAEYENLEADAPVDSGCPECTLNTVPANLDTGLCAHHMRRAAIAKATGAA